jgi:hypothetical protein
MANCGKDFLGVSLLNDWEIRVRTRKKTAIIHPDEVKEK